MSRLAPKPLSLEDKEQKELELLSITPAIVSFVTIFVMILFSPDSLIYDELYHIQGAKLLVEGSSVRELLIAPLPSAPGPLYPVFHALIFPLTELQVPQIRLLNLSLLLVSIVAISICLHLYGFTKPVYRSSTILSVPILWVTSGMALTEIPAFFMATLSCLAGIFAITHQRSKICFFSFILSGLFAGLSVLSRQTYLPLIVIFFVLALYRRFWFWQAMSAFLIAFVVPLPVFMIWGGIYPAISIKHIWYQHVSRVFSFWLFKRCY